MQFKCVNCGGNVVYDPEKGNMLCVSCNVVNSEEIVKQEDCYACPSCGAKLTVTEFTSATKCAYCGAYNIIDEKITYPYGPNLVLPFRFTKNQATELLRKEFKERLFCPNDFLSQRTLENLEGDYVPFWLYSYDVTAEWDGIGTKVRTWTSGDTEYTEVSKYHVYRKMELDFDRVPVDASIKMPDKIMDLMEPYSYGELHKFEPKYMSGFEAETYNQTPDELEERAKKRVEQDSEAQLKTSMTGYNSLTPSRKSINQRPRAREFAMLPIWKYVYRYHGKDYEYYINGQTGKVYGKMPKSIQKIAFSGGTLFVVTMLLMMALQYFVEVF